MSSEQVERLPDELPDRMAYDLLSEQILIWALHSSLSDSAKHIFKVMSIRAAKMEQALEASQQEVERLQELMPDNGQVRCPGCGHDFLIAASRKREEQFKTPDEEPTEITDFPTSRVTPEYMQHASHCNQGEYEGVCKYGDGDCPILEEGTQDE